MPSTDSDAIGQLSAFFATKNGGKIDAGKLMKLLYIANRYHMKRYGHGIYFDTITCASSGPIMHRTRQRITDANFTMKYIKHDAEMFVSPLREYTADDYDTFSVAIEGTIEQTWEMHGYQTSQELIYYMENLYSEINGQTRDITYLDMMKAMDMEHAQHLYEEMLFFDGLDEMFAKYEQ